MMNGKDIEWLINPNRESIGDVFFDGYFWWGIAFIYGPIILSLIFQGAMPCLAIGFIVSVILLILGIYNIVTGKASTTNQSSGGIIGQQTYTTQYFSQHLSVIAGIIRAISGAFGILLTLITVAIY